MTTYEALIFLNNCAITLLERQRYQESIETFADAFRLHRCVIPEYGCNLTQETLRRASKRLARHCVQTFGNMGCLMLDPFIVLDLANADCMPSVLQFGLAIDQIDFVVRINQESEDDFLSDNRKRRLDSAILFLNYGVACKRASCVIDECSEEVRDKLHCQSINLFDISNQIVSHEIESLYSVIKRGCKDFLDVHHYLERALMISMFTSAHISDRMHWQHSIEDGMENCSNFEKSFRSFQTVTRQISSLFTQHAASA